MQGDSRFSAGKMKRVAFRLLAASVFLGSILAPFADSLASAYDEAIAVDALTGRLLWRFKPWRLYDARFEMYSAGLVLRMEDRSGPVLVFLDANTGKPIKPFELESSDCLARSVLRPTGMSETKIRLDNGWRGSITIL